MSNLPPSNCSKFEYDESLRYRVNMGDMEEQTEYLAMLLRGETEALRLSASLEFIPKIGEVAILLRLLSSETPGDIIAITSNVAPDGMLTPLETDINSGYLLSYESSNDSV
jgi:hypothetical protein